MGADDVIKLERTVQFPKLGGFNELLNWSQAIARDLDTRMSTLNSKINDQIWQLIHEKTFEAAANSYTISILDGNTQREYMITGVFKNAANAATNFYLRPNNDSADNYGYLSINSDGTNVTTGTDATYSAFNIGYCNAINKFTFFSAIIYAKSGVQRSALIQANNSVTGATIGAIAQETGIWNNTADNITSLVIATNQADAIGIGSRFTLWSR